MNDKKQITFNSFIPFQMSFIAPFLFFGRPFFILVILAINFVIAVSSMFAALFITGNKNHLTFKKIAKYSIIMIIVSGVYTLIASNFLSAKHADIISPFMAEYFAPKYYNIVTQWFGVVLINSLLLLFLFRRTQLKHKFLFVCILALINSPWISIITPQHQTTYIGFKNNLVNISPKKVDSLREQISFKEISTEFIPQPKIEPLYKTLVTTFEVMVPKDGSYSMNMDIYRDSETNSYNSGGDPHGIYYINDIKTDWYEAPHSLKFSQGKNIVTVKIPLVYTNKSSAKQKYNLFPNRLDQTTYGPYTIKFNIIDFEDESGSIDFTENELLEDGMRILSITPSFNIHALSFTQDQIFNTN